MGGWFESDKQLLQAALKKRIRRSCYELWSWLLQFLVLVSVKSHLRPLSNFHSSEIVFLGLQVPRHNDYHTLEKVLKNAFVNCLQASHEDSCDFMIILCPSCKELMRANEQERHNERECPERTLYCKYCKEPFQLKNIKVRLLSATVY